jgi:phosphoglycolate phosphatase-like HAD superfamily hydrolase
MSEITDMIAKPQAIFFDFDGVILESADIKTEAFTELFKDYPEHLENIGKYHLANLGVSRFKKFEWIYKELFGREITSLELKMLGDRFSAIVYDKVVNAPFVPGIESLLGWSKCTCLNFVASGTPEAELKSIVKHRGLDIYFQEVCGSPRTKSQIVKELLVKYNLDPELCWFVGDANTDHQAAVETGLYFIARNTNVMEAYWKSQQDIWVVDSFKEVTDHFQNA